MTDEQECWAKVLDIVYDHHNSWRDENKMYVTRTEKRDPYQYTIVQHVLDFHVPNWDFVDEHILYNIKCANEQLTDKVAIYKVLNI